MNRIAGRHAVAGIDTGDAAADVERLRRETFMAYPVYLDDGRAARAFGIVSSPTCILVGKGGEILYRGARPPEHLR